MGKTLDKITVALLPVVARGIIRAIRATMRLEFVDCEAFRRGASSGRQCIYAFWHGRLLMMPYFYRGSSISILVSQSKDGELIARTIKGFGLGAVRGSTTRGWLAGTKSLLKAARAGQDLGITPDGPKGPFQKAQMGAVQLARATGLPIVPLAFGCSKKKPFPAGTASSFPIHSLKGSLSAASL